MNVTASTTLLMVSAIYAEAQVPRAARLTPAYAQVPDPMPAQTMGPDDLISIQVSDCVELSHSFRVGPDGTLALPLVNHRLAVSGMLPTDLEEKLAKELVEGGILVAPIVNVAVAEYRSKPVSVVGSVRSPLTFQAMSDTTLLDAIARAGGLTPDAGSEIVITRRRTKNGAVESSVEHIALKSLVDADPLMNVKLYGGEEVWVREVGKIFVAGNVKLPGAFAMQDTSDTTLLKVLALSQGTLPYSQKVAYIYRRDAVTGKRAEIPVELDKIMARKAPDVPVYADDIVYILENHGKKVAGSAIDRIAGTGSSVAAALAYHL